MSRVDAKPLPTQQYLRECFDYDPMTGVLMWLVRPLHHFPNLHRCNNINARFAGKAAGSINPRGYLVVSAGDDHYLVHRVIWKWMTGEEPPQHIDHRDLNPGNNRWRNLRPATKQQNGFNRPVSSRNKLGHKGVNWDARRQTFVAYIRADGKSKFIGRFDSVEEAAAAYRAAAKTIQGEYAHP